MTVHDCKNQHEIRFYGVENSVRKDARETAPNIFFQDTPSLGGCENLVDGVFHGRHETEFQALLTVCIVSGSMPVLRQGLGGGTRTSSSKHPPDSFQGLITWDRLHASTPDVVSATARFCAPKLLNVTVFRWVEAFDQAVG